MPKKIFITGGAGYVGCRLVPYLLDRGYKGTVYDIMYFTSKFLDHKNPNLKIIKGDIRDIKKLENSLKEHEIFLHLACISNDVSYVLDVIFITSHHQKLRHTQPGHDATRDHPNTAHQRAHADPVQPDLDV